MHISMLPSVRTLDLRAAELVEQIRSAEDPAEQERLAQMLGGVISRRGLLVRGSGCRRSVASWIRENLQRDPSLAPLADAVRSAARRAGERAASSGEHDTIGVPEIAQHMGIGEDLIRASLRSRAGRRALGYPIHVGRGEFRFHPVMRTEGRVAYLASLPEVEPQHHLVPLPPEYER